MKIFFFFFREPIKPRGGDGAAANRSPDAGMRLPEMWRSGTDCIFSYHTRSLASRIGKQVTFLTKILWSVPNLHVVIPIDCPPALDFPPKNVSTLYTSSLKARTCSNITKNSLQHKRNHKTSVRKYWAKSEIYSQSTLGHSRDLSIVFAVSSTFLLTSFLDHVSICFIAFFIHIYR